MNRPKSMATPIAAVSHGVSAVRPANAEPLLLAPDANA